MLCIYYLLKLLWQTYANIFTIWNSPAYAWLISFENDSLQIFVNPRWLWRSPVTSSDGSHHLTSFTVGSLCAWKGEGGLFCKPTARSQSVLLLLWKWQVPLTVDFTAVWRDKTAAHPGGHYQTSSPLALQYIFETGPYWTRLTYSWLLNQALRKDVEYPCTDFASVGTKTE